MILPSECQQFECAQNQACIHVSIPVLGHLSGSGDGEDPSRKHLRTKVLHIQNI